MSGPAVLGLGLRRGGAKQRAAPGHRCSPAPAPCRRDGMCCPGRAELGEPGGTAGRAELPARAPCSELPAGLDLPGLVCRGEPEQAAAPRHRSGRLRLHPGWRQPWLHLHGDPRGASSTCCCHRWITAGVLCLWRKYRSSLCPNSCGVSVNVRHKPPPPPRPLNIG